MEQGRLWRIFRASQEALCYIMSQGYLGEDNG